MSHAATNWAIQQRGLKPVLKIILWNLCDRYHPDNGCFPSQERLAIDCEISEATLNRHMKTLERLELISREKRIDPKTKRQKSTRYSLAFESGFKPKPSLKTGHGADSQNEAKPTLKMNESRLSNRETNSVRVTSKRTSKAQKRSVSVSKNNISQKELERFTQILSEAIPTELAKQLGEYRAKKHSQSIDEQSAQLLQSELSAMRDPTQSVRHMILSGWKNAYESEQRRDEVSNSKGSGSGLMRIVQREQSIARLMARKAAGME